MVRNKAVLYTVIACLCLFIFSIPAASSVMSAEPTMIDEQTITDQIEQAVLEAVAGNSRYIQGEMVCSLQVTDIQISQDQQWATAWVVYYDAQIDAILPTEPALAIAHNVNGVWEVFLPTEPGWQAALLAAPDDLLSKDEKQMWLAMNQGTEESIPTQSGYYLPWQAGQTANLSRSVGHDADFSTAHYAFDFYVYGNTVCPGGLANNNLDGAGTTGLNFSLHAVPSRYRLGLG